MYVCMYVVAGQSLVYKYQYITTQLAEVFIQMKWLSFLSAENFFSILRLMIAVNQKTKNWVTWQPKNKVIQRFQIYKYPNESQWPTWVLQIKLTSAWRKDSSHLFLVVVHSLFCNLLPTPIERSWDPKSTP